MLIAVPFSAAHAQVEKNAPKDTAKVVKRLQLRKADTNATAIIPQESKGESKAKSGNTPDTGNRSKKKATGRSDVDKAAFPGGEKGIRDFVRKNVRYPEECKQQRSTGRAIVAITIKADGTPADFAIHKSSGNIHMDKEALRVARLMPKWTPAKDAANRSDFKYMLNVSFRPSR